MNYMLPFFRPAPLQLGCWGWPVTSGNPAVAAYLSWDALEPPDADAHYTERLVRLKHMPVYYVRPPVPSPVPDRTAFGYSANDHVYLCQQNVRKYYPDFDVVLAGILRTDPNGIIAVIADEQPAITAMLTRRLRTTIPDVAARVRVMDRLEREPYLGLVAAADVVLDTSHYGGGANTVLDAVAAAAPMVTHPGQFHRGRWAAAVNHLLGLVELNADSQDAFVKTAVALATDRVRNQAVRQRLRDRGVSLFENPSGVREWEEWLLANGRP
jgi:protein O-GlcNAc transferase